MKVAINVGILQEITDLMSRFVSKHSTLPILENVYIKGNVDTLLFRATDMEKYIEIELQANIKSEGAVTINAKTFADIVKIIEDDEIELHVDQNTDTMIIKTSSDDFKIKGIPASEYVALPEIQKIHSANLDSALFVQGINKVEFAVTEKNFSPVLTGVLMRIKEIDAKKKLIFVGTDSFRLAEYKVDYEGNNEPIDVIVPKVAINEIKKVVEYFTAKGGKEVEMIFAKNLVSFNCKQENISITMTSLLIQGAFPEYENENIIPTSFNTTVITDKNSVDKAIKKVSIMTKDINNYLSFQTKDSTIILQSGETDKGEAQTSIMAVVQGNSVTMGVNGKHISDFVRSIGGNEMIFHIVDHEKPVILTENTDNNYKYVMRPLIK